MNPVTIINTVSYITASLIALMGLAGLLGFLFPPYIPENIRLMVGFMMLLWGIYRILMTRFKNKQNAKREE